LLAELRERDRRALVVIDLCAESRGLDLYRGKLPPERDGLVAQRVALLLCVQGLATPP